MRVSALLATLLLVACTSSDGSGSPEAAPSSKTPQSAPSTSAEPKPRLARFEVARALEDVRRLAGRIGPRLATSPAYREAADLVAERFRDLGYAVSRQTFPVPAGNSWGVPVPAGRSANVMALPSGFDPASAYIVVGAHLDTVAVAPGAEDNASGVAVMLELARLAARQPTRLPTVFVAFGAEEPVGSGDTLHHFGSSHYVREMSATERRNLSSMVALDRVGVGARVPVCTGPLSPHRVRDALLDVARKVGIPAAPCELTTSDHWSFEKAGYSVARLGSTPYAAYHSAGDRPAVVERDQLSRVGRLTWAWLRTS